GLGGERAVLEQPGRSRLDLRVLLRIQRVAKDGPQRGVVRPVVTPEALVEVVQRELEAERRDAVIAHADLAVLHRVAGVVALTEELRVGGEPDVRVLAVARSADDPELRGQARTVEEPAVDRVRERVVERKTPGTRREGLLGGLPVARVPVPLEEVLRELPDVAQVVEELEHPEGAPQLVPAERRRGNLLLEVPRQVQRVDAVEHAEVVRLAPDNLLAAATDGERNLTELHVDPGLTQLVLESERVERVLAEAVQVEVVDGEAPRRR